MADNKLKADISGNLDLGTFNQMEDALKTISNTLDTFPDALKNIMGYAQNLAGTFSEVADPSVIDANIFSSVFLAGIATMMISLELFKDTLSKIPNVSVEVNAVGLDDLNAKLQDIHTEVTVNTEPAKTSLNDIVSLIISGVGVAVSIIGLIRTINSKTSKNILDTVEELGNNIHNILKGKISDDMKKNAAEIGNAFTEGLTGSINEEFGSLKQCIVDISTQMIEMFREAWGIASPSKVMQAFGKFISEGLGIGISDGAKDAVNAMDDMGDGVKDASKSLSKIGDGAKDYTKSLDAVGDATDKVNKKRFLLAGFSPS